MAIEVIKRFFHYTTETRIEEIIQSEVIFLATAGLENKKEKPCAWVSTNPIWEPTATKQYRNGNGDIVQMSFLFNGFSFSLVKDITMLGISIDLTLKHWWKNLGASED